MDFIDKAVMRIEHWLEHNHNHLRSYEQFAAELETGAAGDAARHIRALAELTRESQTCLDSALAALRDTAGRGED